MIREIAKIVNRYEKTIPNLELRVYDIEQDLLFLGEHLYWKKWVGFSILSSIVIGIISITFVGFYIGLFVFLFSFLFLYFLPRIEKNKKETEIEAELPLFMKSFGTLMEMGIDFTNSLSIASNTTSKIKEEVRKILNDVKLGSSLPKSISDAAKRFNSIQIKRGMAHIIESYESGKGREAKIFGSELLNMQRFKLKEYSSKLSIFSLLFIMVSLIAPTFFIIINVLNPIISGESQQGFAVYLLTLFPSLSFSILIASRLFLPPGVFTRRKESYYSIFSSIVTVIILVYVSDYLIKGFLCLISIGTFMLLERRSGSYDEEEVEKGIADALLIISALPSGYGVKEIFQKLTNKKLGKLGKEFEQAYKQLNANIKLEHVINSLKHRINNVLVDRVMDILLYSIKTGGKTSERIAEMADDVLSYIEIKRERIALLSMQKYTLVIGVILIGLITGSVYGMANRLEGNFHVKLPETKYIISYITLTSGIISWFISTNEGKNNSVLIFSILSLVSIIIFFYTIS